MTSLRDRPTPDLIILALSGVICFVLIISTLAMFWAFVSPAHEEGFTDVAKNVAELTNGLIALIVGYIGGRGVGKNRDQIKETDS